MCKLADVDLHGIKCMSLRLASKDAKEIFNANQLPSLDSRDDIVQKLIREYHQVSINFCRITHFNKKTTMQNLTRGEVGIAWRKKALHVKQYIAKCGICNRFRNKKANPPLGKTLVRVNPSI